MQELARTESWHETLWLKNNGINTLAVRNNVLDLTTKFSVQCHAIKNGRRRQLCLCTLTTHESLKDLGDVIQLRVIEPRIHTNE